MTKQEDIYRIGDRVWDNFNGFGWGIVYAIDLNRYSPYLVGVRFDNNIQTYATDGRFRTGDEFPVLSFTEYDLVNGGFSQVRPLPKIAVDTPIFVRMHTGPWNIRYFSHFSNDNRAFCFDGELKSTETVITTAWDEYSIENPLK